MDAGSSGLLPELAYTMIGFGGIEFLHINSGLYTFVTVSNSGIIMTSGGSRMHFRAPKTSKFSRGGGGACPQTPLGGAALWQLPTSQANKKIVAPLPIKFFVYGPELSTLSRALTHSCPVAYCSWCMLYLIEHMSPCSC